MTEPTPTRRALAAPARSMARVGRGLEFTARAYLATPRTARRHRDELLRQVAGAGLGRGRLARVGGTAAVVVVLSGVVGFTIAAVGYANLARAGADSLAGFLSAYLNTRFVVPVTCGIAIVVTTGAGFTAEIGAMRTSGEIDALEAMAVRTVPYVVTTRLLAAVATVVPLAVLALVSAYGASRTVVTLLFGQAPGTYDHYFAVFLQPRDLLASFVELVVVVLVVAAVHCYYGYTVEGGPVEVGVAVGRAVRLSFVALMVVVLLMSMLLYGEADALRVAR